MIDKVFLDMDGVLTDFLGAAARFLNLPCDINDMTHWNAVLDYYYGTPEQFWQDLPEHFWSDYIGWMPDGIRIWNVVKEYNPIILTCPGLFSGGQGKINWLRTQLPEIYNAGNYLIGPTKSVVSRKNCVLIDDSDANIEEWKSEGGYGILVPRLWNMASYFANVDIPDYIHRSLRYLEFLDVRKIEDQKEGGTAV